MLDSATAHSDLIRDKKREDLISDIFKLIKGPITMGTFPDFLVGTALDIYLKYKNARLFTDKTLTQLMINHMLNFDFMT